MVYSLRTPEKTLLQTERRLLAALDFRIYLTKETFQQWAKTLVELAQVSNNQLQQRKNPKKLAVKTKGEAYFYQPPLSPAVK
jgi:hypothetical protein